MFRRDKDGGFVMEHSFETHLYVYWIGREFDGEKLPEGFEGWFRTRAVSAALKKIK